MTYAPDGSTETALSFDAPAEAALERLSRLAYRVLGVSVVIASITIGNRTLLRRYSVSSDPEAAGEADFLSPWIARAVAEAGDAVVVADLRARERGADERTALRAGIVSYAAIPLRSAGGEVIGFVCAADRRSRPWSEEEIGTLHDLAAPVIAEMELRREMAERLRAERALSAAETRFRLLVEHSLVGIYVIGEERVLYANPKFAQIFGYAQSGILDRPVDALVGEEDRERMRENLRRCLAGEVDSVHCAFRGLHKDGGRVEVEVHGTRAEVAGSPSVIGTVLDVTGRRVAQAQLRRAERLASVGTLLGGVAHELSNPLTSIKSFAQLMLLDEHREEDREALLIVQKEADRAAKIVADLRLLARQTQEGDSDYAAVSLNEVAEHTLRLRRYSLQARNVEVRAELADHLPSVWADRGQLNQVVLNLIVNAEQALAEHPGARRLTVRTRASARGALLQVSDNGPGIAPAHLERIFDPFWTTKAPGEGTGLGLSLAHGIVTEHGGDLRVRSEPGGGASFTLEIPRSPVAPVPDGEVPDAERVSSLRILVVDDEPGIRRSLARYLARRGHRVDEANDGRGALWQLDRSGAAYDAVLADLRMPDLGGDQLFTELKRRGDGLADRLVFITGDAASPEAVRILAAAGAPVLLKPFELSRVAQLLEQREWTAAP